MNDEDEPRTGSRARQHLENVIEQVLYDFDPGGYLSNENRTEYTERILENIGWDGLMELLDRHYPIDVFPTGPDLRNRDTGPRIVSLIRHLNTERQRVTWLDKAALRQSIQTEQQRTTAPDTGTRAEGGTDGTRRNA